MSYLDGSVKQKQTQNTTNILTAQWTKNANFLKSMLLNKLKTKLIGQHNGRKTPIHEILYHWLLFSHTKISLLIGHKVIAVDLPGYGKSSKYDGDRGEFLIQLVKTLSPNVKPVLVSPSMSGSFSLPLLNKDPDLICGYIPGKYTLFGNSIGCGVSSSGIQN